MLNFFYLDGSFRCALKGSGFATLDEPRVCLFYGAHIHSVCPLVGIGSLPTPLSPASVMGGGGGITRLAAGEVLEESKFRRLEKKPSILPSLWCTVLEERCLRRKGEGGGEE